VRGGPRYALRLAVIITRLEERAGSRPWKKCTPRPLVEERGKRAQKNIPGGSENVSPESRLKRVLSAGHFAVTAECGPPKGADPDLLRKRETF